MRVQERRVDGVSGHVGRWQPRDDRRYQVRRDINPHAVRRPKALMHVFSARASCLATSAMERFNRRGFDPQRNMVWHYVEALLRSEEKEGEESKGILSVSGQGRSTPCNCTEIVLILSAKETPGVCVRVQLEKPEMQRERQRMCSRQGGTSGRASTQWQGHISPSSSIEVTSVPQRFQEAMRKVADVLVEALEQKGVRRSLPR